MKNKKIIITTSFKGIHNWPEASSFAGEEVKFLEYPHRHTFHVRAELKVTDSDREVEFFVFQNQIEKTIDDLYEHQGFTYIVGRRSCETIAEEIISSLRSKFNYKGPLAMEIWEDKEVGARVEDE